MVLERKYYNNGYGCSCCRSNWEMLNWIKDPLTFDQIISLAKESHEHVTDDDYNCGIVYQENGKTLYGFTTKIYRSPVEISLVVGDKSFVIKDIYSSDFDEDAIQEAKEYYGDYF